MLTKDFAFAARTLRKNPAFTITAILTIALTLCTSAMADEDDALHKLVPADAKVEKLAGGMQFIEGPVWTDSYSNLLKVMRWKS